MKLSCRQVQRMAGAFAEDELDDRDLASVLSHIRNCASCYEELKTAYLISYAIDYMDRDQKGALDIDTLMEEKIRKCESRLQRNGFIQVVLWIGIFLLAAVIIAILLRIFFPGLLPALTDFINRMAAYLPL